MKYLIPQNAGETVVLLPGYIGITERPEARLENRRVYTLGVFSRHGLLPEKSLHLRYRKTPLPHLRHFCHWVVA